MRKIIIAASATIVLLLGISAQASGPFNFFGQSVEWMDTTPGTPAQMAVGVNHNGETIYVVVTVTTDTKSRTDVQVLMVGADYAGHFTVNTR